MLMSFSESLLIHLQNIIELFYFVDINFTNHHKAFIEKENMCNLRGPGQQFQYHE